MRQMTILSFMYHPDGHYAPAVIAEATRLVTARRGAAARPVHSAPISDIAP